MPVTCFFFFSFFAPRYCVCLPFRWHCGIAGGAVPVPGGLALALCLRLGLICVYLNLGKSAARRWPIGIEVDLTWRTGDWQIQCANVRAVGFRTTAIACLIHCLKIATIRQCCR